MRQFKTVFMFEYTNYLKSKGYIGITVFLMLVVIIVSSLPAINGLFGSITGSGTPETSVVEESVNISNTEAADNAMIVDTSGVYTDQVLAAYMPQYNWVRFTDLNGAEEAILNGEYSLAVGIDGLTYTLYEKGGSMFAGSSQGIVAAMISDMHKMTYLTDRGLDAAETMAALNEYPSGEVFTIGKDQSQTFWLSYVMVFLMYMVILLYGQFVSTSVITEKSTKTMELLITSAKPFQLMFGKVVGVGMAGLTQFGLIIVTALTCFRINSTGWKEFQPMVAALLDSSVSLGLVAYAILFFLLGFFCFAFIYAAFASTVSRMEEANSAVLIPQFLFIAAFFVAIFGSMTPEANFVTVCSFVPFLSPVVMFMRICVLDMSFIQILAAIIINVATVFGAAFVSSRIYRVGVMMYGKKANIKDIVRFAIKAS